MFIIFLAFWDRNLVVGLDGSGLFPSTYLIAVVVAATS